MDTSTALGCNLFNYCGNDPVNRIDQSGGFWDIIFDVVSLVSSIVDVCQNPDDPWAWAGLAGDAVDLIPFVTGIGETMRAIKTVDRIVDTVDDIHDTARTVSNAAEAAKPLHRPYIRKSTRNAVEARTPKTADGRFIDVNTGKPIDGKYDLGHITGKEFRRERDIAMSKGWSQKQFNDYMNNPDFYQIEDPSSNRSHRFEMKGK